MISEPHHETPLEIVATLYHLWTVREGRIGELTAFHDTAAMEAALRS